MGTWMPSSALVDLCTGTRVLGLISCVEGDLRMGTKFLGLALIVPIRTQARAAQHPGMNTVVSSLVSMDPGGLGHEH